MIYYSPDNAKSQSEKRKLRIDFAVSMLTQEDNLTLKKANKIIRRVRKYVIVEKTGDKITWAVNKIAINRAEKNDGKFCIISKTAKEISPSYNLSIMYCWVLSVILLGSKEYSSGI